MRWIWALVWALFGLQAQDRSPASESKEDLDPSVERVVLLYKGNRLEEAERLAKEILAEPETKARQSSVASQLQAMLGRILTDIGRMEEGMRRYRLALSIAEKTRSLPDELRALNLLAELHLGLGEIGAARRYATRAYALAESGVALNCAHGVVALQNFALLKRAERRPQQAEALFRRALSAWESCSWSNAIWPGVILANLGQIAMRDNRLDEAERWFYRLMEAQDQLGAPDVAFAAVLNFAELSARRGDRDAARQHLERARAFLADMPVSSGDGMLTVLVASRIQQFAEIYERLGEKKEAKRLKARASSLRQGVLPSMSLGHTVDVSEITPGKR